MDPPGEPRASEPVRGPEEVVIGVSDAPAPGTEEDPPPAPGTPVTPAEGRGARLIRQTSEQNRRNAEAIVAAIRRPRDRERSCGASVVVCCNTFWGALGYKVFIVAVVSALAAGIMLTVAGVDGDGDGYLIAGIIILALFGLPCVLGALATVVAMFCVIGAIRADNAERDARSARRS